MSETRILVVDDEPSVRGLLRVAVGAPGVLVVDAADASGALQLANQHGFFDLVITDIQMPGTDGLELARRLRRAQQASRFLFISGYSNIGSLEEGMREFENAAFLAKPFQISELLREVRGLMERRPPPRMASVRRRAGRDMLEGCRGTSSS